MNLSNTTISILGCGWLGFSVAKYFVAKGAIVKGSTTTKEKIESLRENKIIPFQIKVDEKHISGNKENFFDCDVLIISIPPKRNIPGFSYEKVVERLAKEIKDTSKVIFISSTSVYKANNDEVDESSEIEDGERGKTIFLAEENLKESVGKSLTILRCGGLMGYDRIPGKYFAGKKDLTTASVPVNYIHRDDVVSIISQVVLKDTFWGEVFNLVAPMHPSRKEVYEKNALDFNFSASEFQDNNSDETPYKIVSSKKLIQSLGYDFIFPNPLEFDYTR